MSDNEHLLPPSIPASETCVAFISSSVSAVETILNYQFKDKSLLVEALTHSCIVSASYQRLELVGDAALGLFFYIIFLFLFFKKRSAASSLCFSLLRSPANFFEHMKNKKQSSSHAPSPKPKKTGLATIKSEETMSDNKDLISPSIIEDLTQSDNQISSETSDAFMSSSVSAVEKILNYQFKDKSLLVRALTHSSCIDSASYQRLEFVGDAALGLALANFLFIKYPGLGPHSLTLLRSANTSTETLARVAVRKELYGFMRLNNAPSLDQRVREFARAVEEEGDTILPYGGSVKAPKVLADLVESVAAAVYMDCNLDLKRMWEYLCPLLEPIVTLENLQLQPVTMMYELCQKQGFEFKNSTKGQKNVCNVFVDGMLVGQACSDHQDTSKLTAAKVALQNLLKWDTLTAQPMEIDGGLMIEIEEIDGAKQKLQEICDKRRWPKPTYRVEKEVGPSHDKRFISSVQIETTKPMYVSSGDLKGRVKDAENSAASRMLNWLKDTNMQLN